MFMRSVCQAMYKLTDSIVMKLPNIFTVDRTYKITSRSSTFWDKHAEGEAGPHHHAFILFTSCKEHI